MYFLWPHLLTSFSVYKFICRWLSIFWSLKLPILRTDILRCLRTHFEGDVAYGISFSDMYVTSHVLSSEYNYLCDLTRLVTDSTKHVLIFSYSLNATLLYSIEMCTWICSSFPTCEAYMKHGSSKVDKR